MGRDRGTTKAFYRNWSFCVPLEADANDIIEHHQQYARPATRRARASIFEYIEVFYNRKRLRSSLGYKKEPEAFEAGLN